MTSPDSPFLVSIFDSALHWFVGDHAAAGDCLADLHASFPDDYHDHLQALDEHVAVGHADGPWWSHAVEKMQGDLQRIHDGTWTRADDALEAARSAGLQQQLMHGQADLVTQQGHQAFVDGNQLLVNGCCERSTGR